MAHLLFSWSGRMNRQAYWLVSLGLIVFSAVVFVIATVVLSAIVSDASGSTALSGLLTLLASIFYLLISLAIMVRRLQDRDRSAWWLIPFVVLPMALEAAAGSASSALTTLAGVVSLVLTLWGFVEIGLLRGTRGPNRYGEDPLTTTESRAL